MAMWFSHLRYAEEMRVSLSVPLERLAISWGCLCCDVDKITSVPREVSHYGREGLDFEPEQFLECAGVSAEAALAHEAFLAGYLSHMAVDEAWYGHLFRLRDRHPGIAETWTEATTRALNLALDRRNRGLANLSGLDWSQATGEDVLSHLRGPVREVMAHAAGVYTSWPGTLHQQPTDPLLGPVLESFRTLARAEAPRVEAVLAVLDTEALDREVVDFTTRSVQRFADDLHRRAR